MAQCEFCLNHYSIQCIGSNGVKYGKPIEDFFEGINCPCYLENGFAGAMAPAFDNEFLTCFN